MARRKHFYYVGFCRICGTGPLGLRECGGCDRVVVLCDECDSAWPDADFTAPPTIADEARMPCPHCGASLYEPPSRWARMAKLHNTAWLQEALATGRLEVQQGAVPGRES